jgi:uncharacterized membrane protein YeaQ/YmgE (transglycosylase-associated protein family)
VVAKEKLVAFAPHAVSSHPATSIGLVTGMQNMALSLAGIAGPLLTGWRLQTTGSYTAPMEAILFFPVLGGAACVVLLGEKWAPVSILIA